MSTKQRIDQDLKSAMLSGDKALVTLLRGLKSAILYVEVAQGNREQGLPEPMVMEVLAKEAKKRQESADMYRQAGAGEREKTELAEKVVIEKYLPIQMEDEKLAAVIDATIAELGSVTGQTMGVIIGKVKQLTAGKADGGRIAAAVKERMEK